MRTRHLAPNDPVLARLLIAPLFRLLMDSVDICDSLATVVRGLLATLHTIQLQEGRVWMLVPPPSLVPNKYAFVVEPNDTPQLVHNIVSLCSLTVTLGPLDVLLDAHLPGRNGKGKK